VAVGRGTHHYSRGPRCRLVANHGGGGCHLHRTALSGGRFQRQGIGSRVIRAVIDEATRERKAVTLSVVKINPARRLYERLGFSVTHEDLHKVYMRREPDRMPA